MRRRGVPCGGVVAMARGVGLVIIGAVHRIMSDLGRGCGLGLWEVNTAIGGDACGQYRRGRGVGAAMRGTFAKLVVAPGISRKHSTVRDFRKAHILS